MFTPHPSYNLMCRKVRNFMEYRVKDCLHKYRPFWRCHGPHALSSSSICVPLSSSCVYIDHNGKCSSIFKILCLFLLISSSCQKNNVHIIQHNPFIYITLTWHGYISRYSNNEEHKNSHTWNESEIETTHQKGN
jgi:hypothetical protein